MGLSVALVNGFRRVHPRFCGNDAPFHHDLVSRAPDNGLTERPAAFSYGKRSGCTQHDRNRDGGIAGLSRRETVACFDVKEDRAPSVVSRRADEATKYRVVRGCECDGTEAPLMDPDSHAVTPNLPMNAIASLDVSKL